MKKSAFFVYTEKEALKFKNELGFNYMTEDIFFATVLKAVIDDDVAEFFGEETIKIKSYLSSKFNIYNLKHKFLAKISNLPKNNDEFAEFSYQLYMIDFNAWLENKNQQNTNVFSFVEYYVNDKPTSFFKEVSANIYSHEKNDSAASYDMMSEFNSSSIKQVEALVKKVKGYQSELLKKIYGQDVAVSTFISGYFQAEMNKIYNNKTQKPMATFLFAGPPGTGKTYLSQCAADLLERPFARFDMSEYSDKEASLEFIGSDKVYKNGKAGNVTSYVAENPNCVILFDEIEKAHLNIIHLFLQILDVGRLRDSFTDEEVSFENAIIFFTTNAGKNFYDSTDAVNLSSVSRKELLKALQSDTKPDSTEPYFPAAICSRFATGNVVMFNRISADSLRKIAQKEFNRYSKMFSNKTKVTVETDNNVFSTILLSEGAGCDARTIKSKAISTFNNELFELLRLLSNNSHDKGIGRLKKITFKVSVPENNEITDLYYNKRNYKVLVFADETVSGLFNGLGIDNVEFICISDAEKAKNKIISDDIDFVLCDYSCGCNSCNKVLNMSDIVSEASEVFSYIQSYASDLPVYIIGKNECKITEEEKVSFIQSGAQDIFVLSDNSADNRKKLLELCEILHQQSAIISLGKANKILTYETAQRISDDGSEAVVEFYSLRLCVAPDTEDKNKLLDLTSKPNVKMEQVIGAEDAKEELCYFIDYLKDPKGFVSKSLRAPKGVLLYGPPGTGKTMLAKAMATESDTTFIAVQANEFLKSVVGQGPEEVRNLFKTARKYAPSIIFIDEIEVIGKLRDGSDGGNKSMDILNALLNEMDGFKTDLRKPVFVLAATNYDIDQSSATSLDPALVRRFDRRIYVDLPNKEERISYLKLKLSEIPFSALSESEIESFSVRTTGKSLADIETILEFALRNLYRSKLNELTYDVLSEAYEAFYYGEKKVWDSDAVLRTARHEAGHALVSWCRGNIPTHVTVVSRGNFGGYMLDERGKNSGSYTKEELLSEISILLGGRAAELICYGEEDGLTTGPSSDLRRATDLAEMLICDYSMDNEMGMGVINKAAASGEIQLKIRERVNEILNQSLKATIETIKGKMDIFEKMVNQLVSKNHLTADDIKAIFNS